MTEQDKQGAEPDLRNAPPAGLTPRQKEIQRRQFASEQQGAEREAFKTWWCASDEYNYAHTGSAASAWEAGRAALRAEQQGQEPVQASADLRKTITPRAVDGSLDDYWMAPSGEGPRAYDWKDKPHRLIYDLIAHVLYYTRPAPASQPVGEAVADPAVDAIQFALEAEDGMTWLRLWNEGEFDTCRREWPEAPEDCYIGADPLHALTQAAPTASAQEADGQAAFAEWFVKNYPGPDTIIHDPHWHAPRIYRAAMAAAPSVAQAGLSALRELLGHISDVLPDEAFDKIDTAKWNAVSATVGEAVAPVAKIHLYKEGRKWAFAVTDADVSALSLGSNDVFLARSGQPAQEGRAND